MGRNLLIGTSSPYPWDGSDYPNAVNLSTAGKVIHTDGSNHFDAYIWLHHRTCFVDPIYALHKIGEYLTLSVDVKIAGSSGGTTLFQFDLRHQSWGTERYLTRVYFTGDTDWKRVYLPLKASQAQNEESVMSLFCVDCTNCPIDTTVEWKNMKLEVGPEGSDWTPAPEEITYYNPNPVDFEQGSIMVGSEYAGKTYSECKTPATIRIRTKELLPVTGQFFYFEVPSGLQMWVAPYKATGYAGEYQSATKVSGVYTLPTGTVGVAVCMSKTDANAVISPIDVTSVSGGGAEMATLARKSISLDRDLSPTIDAWTSDAVQNGVTKINGGYIQTQTIKSEHLIVEDIFATGSAAMNIISARELNADLITSGTINANFLSLYGMKVLNKTTNQETLNITDGGEITLRGSVESYNYNNGKTGWAIKHDGDAEFNDVVVRGSVITNDGGIVSSGGSGRNLFANSSFQETTTQTLWNTTKNGNLIATQWNGYSGGVANASSCYHAHLYNFQGENVYRYKKETEIWLGICYSGSLLKSIEVGGTYTFSCQLYRVSGGNGCSAGLYYCKTGETSYAFHAGMSPNFSSSMVTGQWVTVSYTFTVAGEIDLSKGLSFYIYGAIAGDTAGEFYMRRPKLEKGSIATPWSPAPEDRLKQVRFWAGSSYDERESAPWIVYNDGSMVATKGTFSGVFSGDIKIGNISITDPSSSTGNDAILTITNGSTGVEAVQLTDRGTSVFRQSVVFRSASAGSTDTTISLEPNGTGIFKSSVQVGSGANVAGLENDKLVIRGHTLTHNSSGLQSNSDFFVGEAAHKKNLKTYGDMYATGVVRTDDMVLFADKAQMKIVANGLNIDVFNS